MAHQFSQNLRARLIRYLKKYHGLVISNETADEYLNSWAIFYLSFERMRRIRTSPAAKDETPHSLT